MTKSDQIRFFSERLPATFVAVLFLVLSGPAAVTAGDVLAVGNFSNTAVTAEGLPEGWQPLTFRKIKDHTDYDIVQDSGLSVIRADSNASASGLIRKIRIDPMIYPLIQWRWKISNVYENGDVTRKGGDDYPARIYIAFEYDPGQAGILEKAQFEGARLIYGEYPPGSAVNYIWESRAPLDTRVPNPFTDRVMMIVVESGPDRTDTWITAERNIYQDYLDCFGRQPPLITGVAIMTDSDNTGEAATAYYGDIIFKSGPTANP
ncbi:MAG: DUF3047 domain-containing protein [Thermodesulfobacteriota bacterium]